MKKLWAHVDPLISSENDAKVIPLGSMWEGVSLNKPDWVKGDMKRGRIKTQSDVQANRASTQDLLYLWASHLGCGYLWTRQVEEEPDSSCTNCSRRQVGVGCLPTLTSPTLEKPHLLMKMWHLPCFTAHHWIKGVTWIRKDREKQLERDFFKTINLLSLPDSMPSRYWSTKLISLDLL